jgi:hypothetical protein
MGGFASSYSYWTAEEAADNEKIAKLQEQALEFVSKNLFYAIAVRSQRKSKDPTAPIWVEPLPHIVEESLMGKSPNGDVSVELLQQHEHALTKSLGCT